MHSATRDDCIAIPVPNTTDPPTNFKHMAQFRLAAENHTYTFRLVRTVLSSIHRFVLSTVTDREVMMRSHILTYWSTGVRGDIRYLAYE
jgi:hypothetical protein